MKDDSESPNRASIDRSALTARELAVAMKTEIELRAKLFDDLIVGDSSWRILLELFIANENVPVTSISVLGGMRATTGLRWIDLLNQKGFLSIIYAANDNRKKSLSLTEQGEEKMNGYFEVVKKLSQQ